MKNNETRFMVGFAVVAVLVFAGAVLLKGRNAFAPDGLSGSAAQSNDSANSMPVAATPLPDSIAISPAADLDSSGADGDEIVADATAGYYFSMPVNWYAEKSAGTGLTVYPDYDPKSEDTPNCKIEISTFASASSESAGDSDIDLNKWITAELHADPTAQVSEISRTPVAIGEARESSTDGTVATSSAIEWFGTLNGVTTTLVYAIEPNSGGMKNGNVLEIAPSTLSDGGDTDNDDCNLDLQALLANLQFGTYEP